MLLKYSLCLPGLAASVDEAVKNVIDQGVRTPDIGGKAKTSEVGDAIAEELSKVLSKK